MGFPAWACREPTSGVALKQSLRLVWEVSLSMSWKMESVPWKSRQRENMEYFEEAQPVCCFTDSAEIWEAIPRGSSLFTNLNVKCYHLFIIMTSSATNTTITDTTTIIHPTIVLNALYPTVLWWSAGAYLSHIQYRAKAGDSGNGITCVVDWNQGPS